MADLKAIITKLAAQMQSAADQIPGGTGAGGAGGAEDRIARLETELDLEKQLGAERERLLELEIEISRLRALDEDQRPAEVENIKNLNSELESLRSSTKSAETNSRELKDAWSSLGGTLKDALSGPLQQITGMNSAMGGLGKSVRKVTMGAIRPIGTALSKSFGGLGKIAKGFGLSSKAAKSFGIAAKAAWAAATLGITIVIEVITTFISLMMGPFLGALAMVDAAGAKFARLTGTTDRWNDSLMAVNDEAFRLGISAERSAKTMADLTQKFSGFNNLSQDTAKTLGVQVLLMEELGVASSTQIGVLDSLNRVMGISGAQAGEFSKDLFDMASAARMAPEEMFASFRQALPQLSVYGSKMKTEFQKLTAQ